IFASSAISTSQEDRGVQEGHTESRSPVSGRDLLRSVVELVDGKADPALLTSGRTRDFQLSRGGPQSAMREGKEDSTVTVATAVASEAEQVVLNSEQQALAAVLHGQRVGPDDETLEGRQATG
ncbi:unnamed protein product, partial [Sphacelaria rigidula]